MTNKTKQKQTLELIKQDLKAGKVTRYHSRSLNIPQDVAQHTLNMLLIHHRIFGIKDKNVLNILHHDLPELLVGDVPYPTKAGFPEVGAVMKKVESAVRGVNGWEEFNDSESKLILKMLDYLEVHLHLTVSMEQYGESPNAKEIQVESKKQLLRFIENHGENELTDKLMAAMEWK